MILNQSINCGLKNGALCCLGAATADFTYAMVAFTTGGFFFSLLDNKKEIIPIVSSAILIIFSFWMIYSTLKKQTSKHNREYTLVCKYPFITTYGLTIASPMTIIVFTSFVGLINPEIGNGIYLHAFVIFIASLFIQLLIAFLGSKLANFISKPSTLLYFNLASGIGIMLFGISKLV